MSGVGSEVFVSSRAEYRKSCVFVFVFLNYKETIVNTHGRGVLIVDNNDGSR